MDEKSMEHQSEKMAKEDAGRAKTVEPVVERNESGSKGMGEG